MSGYPWFTAPTKVIRRAVDEDRLAHGLLIVIPSGWGREAFLHELARTILENPSVPSELETWAHADFQWVQSYDNEGNPSKVIQVDAIRALAHFAVQRAAIAPRKLAILPQAHNITVPAANALLKTLEEPVSNCCIVLETSRPAQLLPTVVSRCQRLPFRFSRQEAMDFLKSQNQSDATSCLDLAGGGPLDAIALSQTPEIAIHRAVTRLGSDRERTAELDRMAKSGNLLDMLDQWYRLVIRIFSETKVNESNDSLRGKLLEFADELLIVRNQIESVKGVNTRLLLDRLAFLWLACAVS